MGQGQHRVIIYIVELVQCCMSCFKLIGLPVLEKKIFEGFYHMGMAAILVTNTILKIYVPFSQEGSTLNFGFNWSGGFGEEDV